MSKKILVVDDDKDIIEPLALILETSGFKVKTVTKGKQVYSGIDTFNPDLLLLDILMSGSDGREICKNLKKNKKTKDLIIIMMSAHPNGEKDSQEIEADDFIAKPFETEELLTIINKYLH
ncbi:MAG TPA: response regulator [Verrucomicrobiae bacterium]|nr:response regulator [Verrucomicrobiae bacterium]